MEVHHHPDLHHSPKKWKEYLLEFLMIFLAVTLGFIAENIREHFSERAKERQYIAGFIRNLKDDTANLRHVIEFDKRQVMGLDSALQLSHLSMASDVNRISFYRLVIHYLYNSSSFKSNDATIQQLKSTGDYRLIKEDHVVDSLTKYDAEVRDTYIQGNYYESYFKEILSRLDDLTDMTIFANSGFDDTRIMKGPLPPLRDDGQKLPTFFNKIFVFRGITSSYAENDLKPQLEYATRLISFLEKEYDSEF